MLQSTDWIRWDGMGWDDNMKTAVSQFVYTAIQLYMHICFH